MSNHFVADRQTLLILRKLLVVIDQLLLAGLDGKVGLSNSDNFFIWIAIHYDQIARIARKHYIIDFTLGSRSQRHHFRDLTKMVFYVKASIRTGLFCSFNGFVEIFPSCVFENTLQFTGQPVFFAILVYMLDAFKCLLAVFYKFTHKPSSFKYCAIWASTTAISALMRSILPCTSSMSINSSSSKVST